MSNLHSPSAHVLVKPSLDPEVRTADANGLGVDCRGFRRALMVCHLGAHDRGDSNETIDFELEESTDNSTFSDVANGNYTQLGAVTPNVTAGNVYLVEIDLTKRLRYLRAVINVGGTTPSCATSVVFLLFDPVQKGVSQDAAVIRV